MNCKYVSLAHALFIKFWSNVRNACRSVGGCSTPELGLMAAALGKPFTGCPGSRPVPGFTQFLPVPCNSTSLIGIGGYCLKSKIMPEKYNYRLVLSKMASRLCMQKSRKSLVFRYQDTVLPFFIRKVESRISFLKSLFLGGFYYHSQRNRRKVESRKVSGGF